MYILKDFIETLPRIPEEFTDLEGGESFAQSLQTGNGQQVIIAVGRSAGTCQRPDQEEPVVDDVEGFGLVAEVMFPARAGGGFVCFGSIGTDPAVRLVGAAVVNISSLWVTPGCETTMIQTGRCITGAALLVRQASWATAMSSRLRTGWHLMTADHP